MSAALWFLAGFIAGIAGIAAAAIPLCTALCRLHRPSREDARQWGNIP